MWVALGALLAGCAHLLQHPEAPHVTVADLRPVQMGLFEQRFRLQLRIQNPNDFALPIDGMEYQLDINDQPFAQGVSAEEVSIPAYGEELVDVEVVSTLGGFLQQLRKLQAGKLQTLNYRLEGKVALQGYLSKLPFVYQGELAIPRLAPGH